MPAKWKYKAVEELTKKINESKVVAVASILGMPSRQMAEIRAKVRDDLDMKVTKNTLAKMAIKKSSRPGATDLLESIDGPTAFIFSNDNPFKLYQKFYSSRVNAPAKAGQKAPMDLIVPAGDTSFKPGPIIGDLQAVGIKAKIQGPIIVIVADSPVIKEGEVFSSQLANVLTQLEIFPMEIGVNIRVALEDGMIYSSDTLNIDTETTFAQFVDAARKAQNLAVEVAYPTKQTMPILLTKAATWARNLAIEAEIINDETVDYFLEKGTREANSVAKAANYEPGASAPAPVAEEKKEETPSEEKTEDTTGDKPEETQATPAESSNDAKSEGEAPESS